MFTRKEFEPIPVELQDDYSKLEMVLKNIAKEKGPFYRVKEWRPWFYSTSFDDEQGTMSSVKRYTFAGYKIDHGIIRPRTILLASFDTPETYDIRRPLPVEDQSRVLAITYDSFYFNRFQFNGKLIEEFPKRHLHIEEMVRR